MKNKHPKEAVSPSAYTKHMLYNNKDKAAWAKQADACPFWKYTKHTNDPFPTKKAITVTEI